MAGIFEISTDYIKQLDDEAARELVARLCRAELRRQLLPESAVTWGGDQRAKDGGVDVRVDCPSPLWSSEYVKTPATAFQVKAEKFPPSKIEKEMAPRGVIRPAIADLARAAGTYVIASSQDDVSDKSLNARRAAMAECLAKFEIETAIQHDFYGSRQIADWVEQHPEIGNWLRGKIGMPLNGWRPYGPWAYNENSLDAEYVVDDRARVFVPEAEEGSTVKEAIGQLRKELRRAVSIRIVGLSGVGKTRLVQALFDARVCDQGDVPPAESVIYTDLADEPDPQPKALVENLIERSSDAVVIIDNCGPDTHSRLTELAKKSGSLLKLITIEYDIRDDLPEGTLCYRLEGSSPELIIQLLRRRFSHLSVSDADRIAAFSDGNARVAFALAATAGTGGELSQLKDAELFKRLFQQKNDPSDELLRCAEAASLLYSFDGEDPSETGEVAILARFVDATPVSFRRHMVELKRRGLLQQRGQWRAVLPHAIANGLAARMLESLQADLPYQILIEDASERVSRSFSRRLGFLHESNEAVAITSKLLSAEGKLGDLKGLSPFESQMFANVAPVDPKGAIETLERAATDDAFVSIDNNDRVGFIQVARSLAYEPEWFDRAVSVLKRFALAEPQGFKLGPAQDMLKSLFYCHLSGTKALVEQRLGSAKALLASADNRERDLGFDLINAGLTSSHFSSHYGFDFGARRRDYGWYPRTLVEVQDWYRSWIELAVTVGERQDADGKRARVALGEALRGLWGRIGLDDELMQYAERLRAVDGWSEGWLGVRRILQWDTGELTATSLAQLQRLERSLAPSNLASEIRARVLARGSFAYDLEDDNDIATDAASTASDRYRRAQQKAEELGVQAAATPDLLDELLPDLMARSGSNNLYSFGQGVGRTYENKPALLEKVNRLIADDRSGSLSLMWVKGLIRGWHESQPDAVQAFLDEAIGHPVWSERFVELQVQADLNERAFKRLECALENGRCPTLQFQYLAMGQATDALSIAQVIALAEKILARPDGGFSTAIDLLAMVIYCTDKKDDRYKTELGEALLDLLGSIDWAELKPDRNEIDHDLGVVLNYAIQFASSDQRAHPILQRLMQTVENGWIQTLDVRKTALKPFFWHFPRLALDTVCVPDEDGRYGTADLLVSEGFSERSETALESVPSDILIKWCEQSPEGRFPFAATACAFLVKEKDNKASLKISATAIQLLSAAPDKGAILERYVKRLWPNTWSGSLADRLESRLPLLQQLNPQDNPATSESIAQAEAALRVSIDAERERDAANERRRNSSFE